MGRKIVLFGDSKYTAEIRRIIDKYNRKVRKNRQFAGQPGTISLTEISEKFSSKKDFRREFLRIQRYLKKGAEKLTQTKNGIYISNYLLNEIRIAIRRENKKRKKIREENPESPYKGTQGSHKEMGLLPKKNLVHYYKNKSALYSWIERTLKSADLPESARYEGYKANYLNALNKYVGNEELRKRIEKLSPQEVFHLFFEYPELQIQFLYSSIEVDKKVKRMKNILNKYERSKK